MAKVEINESEVKVQYMDKLRDTENKESSSEEPQQAYQQVDIDSLVDICVERVFELLKANYDR